MTATIQAQDGALTSPPPKKVKKPADPRYLALRNFALSISAFNVFGYTLLGFEQPWLFPLFAVLCAHTLDISLETIMAWAYKRKPEYRGRGMRGLYEFMLPAQITALAVNMLLYANNQFWPIMFGVTVAVGSKYVFRAPINGRMRHFMNPSNFGIAVVLLCFARWVSISPPYMFSEWASEYFRLFTNYRVTDPGTTPTRPRSQFMFGSIVAFVYAVLMQFNIVYTLFFATAIVCGFRGLGRWGAFWMKTRRSKGAAPSAATTDGTDTVPETAASNGAGKVTAGETVSA